MVVKELFARLGLQVDPSGFVKADALLGILSNTLAAIGAAAGVGAVALGAVLKKTVDAGDAAAKAAQQYGISTDAVQKLGYAAEFSGTSFEELGGALAFLAKKGSKDVEGDLRAIADTLAEMPDGGAKTAFVIEKLGRGASRLIPLLNGGSKALDAFGQEAEDLGVVLDGELVESSEALNDSLDRLWKVGVGVFRRAVAPLIPEILRISDAIYDWVRGNKELIRTNMERVAKALVKAVKVLDTTISNLNDTLQFLVKWADAAAIAIGATLLAAAVIAAGGFEALAIASWSAVTGVIAGWIAAAAPVVALAAALFLVGTILEDLWVGFTGGESIVVPALERMVNKLREVLVQFGADVEAWIRDIGRSWVDAFKSFFVWIGDQFGLLGARAMQAFEAPLKAFRSLFGAAPSPVGPEGAPAASFGGGDSPAASAVASPTGNVTVAPSFTGTFNVTAAPGQDPQAVAGVVRDTLDAWHNAKMRETMAAVGA